MSLIFKIFLILIYIHIHLTEPNRCDIKPFDYNINSDPAKPELTIPILTAELLKKGKDELTSFLGQPSGIKSDPKTHQERISKCLASCYGIVFYTDSCQEFKFDGENKQTIYRKMNAVLKEKSEDLTKYPVINSIVTNIDECLASPTAEKDLELKSFKGLSYTFRITYLKLSASKTILENGDILKNQGFLSTTIDPKAMTQYAKDQKHVLVFSSEFEETAPQVRGKIVKPCSVVPQDNEFLMARNQCWKVMHVMDFDSSHNEFNQMKLYEASIKKETIESNKPGLADLPDVSGILQNYNFQLGKKRNRIVRILTADTNKSSDQTKPTYKTGNEPNTFHSKRIFLQSVECPNPETEYAAIM